MPTTPLLSAIQNPDDLKKLAVNQLPALSAEIRETIIDKLSKVGGHIGPNLGIVEATVALHYVFDSPKDKIVWDVSHQSNTHKLLTGRQAQFAKFHAEGGCSGFTSISESPHDFFNVGHTSTAVSLAGGLAKARDLKFRAGDTSANENIIAVLGDGSLSGGEAFEGLNVAGALGSNFIVLFNDNEMSIDPNHGGLYGSLNLLRHTQGGSPNNIFKALGLDYKYVEHGNDAVALVAALREIKDIDHPIVLHIHTKKGKGLKWAEEDPAHWHYHNPFDVATGKLLKQTNSAPDPTLEYLSAELTKNSKAVVVVAGTPMLGTVLQQSHPHQYIDVGIAEGEAVAMSSGIAKNGVKPYLVVASTFVQRAYDQIMQDWCLNNTPATLIILGGGISSADHTHAGLYDIPMLSNIPNLVYLAPTSVKEYQKMLEWVAVQPFPTAIRFSGGLTEGEGEVAPIELGKSQIVQNGSEVALVGLGNFLGKAKEVSVLLQSRGILPTIINPRFITHLDTELLASLVETHSAVAVLEDGMLSGGFAEHIARFFADKPNSNGKILRVHCFGAKKEWTDGVPYSTLINRYHLNAEQIVEGILG
ncbi:1-deoxy-D-xylulose-5-phosphate synthase [Fibrobacterales bacterium]|nr:1-deoxy-D-xylulose-5-phosphate synthase [Fibrobacterales bacterium]